MDKPISLAACLQAIDATRARMAMLAQQIAAQEQVIAALQRDIARDTTADSVPAPVPQYVLNGQRLPDAAVCHYQRHCQQIEIPPTPTGAIQRRPGETQWHLLYTGADGRLACAQGHDHLCVPVRGTVQYFLYTDDYTGPRGAPAEGAGNG